MPRRTSAGKRYAEAVAGIAREAGSWQRWLTDLQGISTALDDPLVRQTLESPRVDAERKQALLDGALAGAISPEARNLVRVMIRRGRIELLPDVVTWFGEMADRALGITRFTVTSAVPLTEDERGRLRTRLGEGRGQQVVLTEQVAPEIIGGLVIREEDIIHDYSVRARLQSLRDRLN